MMVADGFLVSVPLQRLVHDPVRENRNCNQFTSNHLAGFCILQYWISTKI